MDIRYKIAKQIVSFTQKEYDDLFSYVLTNQKGDCIIQSLEDSKCKSFGFFKRDNEKHTLIKIIDWFGTKQFTTKNIEIQEYSITKEFSSPYYENEDSVIGFEKITISPNGGFIFETNVDSNIIVDLDIRYFSDFSKFGKEYKIYQEEGILFIEFIKKNENSNEEDLKVYIGIKTQNLIFKEIQQWIEKEYSYDALRGIDSKEFIFRALEIEIQNVHKKIHIGYSTTKEEVYEQLIIMDNFEHIIEEVERGIDEESFGKTISQTPLSMQTQLGYDIAKRKIFDFLVRDSKLNAPSIIAGYPWFYQEWSRDEVFSLRGFLEVGETKLVHNKLIEFCNLINEKGDFPRLLHQKGSLNSIDAPLLLAKRIEDYIFYVDKKEGLVDLLQDGTIELFYQSLLKIFNGVMKHRWNSEKELLEIEKGDWWRDTIDWVKSPLALQVSMLNTISTLAILSKILEYTTKCEEFLDFENDFKLHIKELYFKNNILVDEPDTLTITCDVFLAYYHYPSLCSQEEWKIIFRKTLSHLYLSWGGISSLSKHDSRFQQNYTGGNDISYHQGDSWYFMNAICTMCLYHCDKDEFKQEITTISSSLTKQLLFKGAFGHIAEVSSASKQETRGCIAQTWSLALYIEMMHLIYGIEK
ncbi:MAG: amylo-alpha-1,6-glucosidase [Candidatus Woesearchaeota archaeon]